VQEHRPVQRLGVLQQKSRTHGMLCLNSHTAAQQSLSSRVHRLHVLKLTAALAVVQEHACQSMTSHKERRTTYKSCSWHTPGGEPAAHPWMPSPQLAPPPLFCCCCCCCTGGLRQCRLLHLLPQLPHIHLRHQQPPGPHPSSRLRQAQQRLQPRRNLAHGDLQPQAAGPG
jgi:hypothetical protein